MIRDVGPWFCLPYWHCACAQDFVFLSVLGVLEVFVNVNSFLSQLFDKDVSAFCVTFP